MKIPLYDLKAKYQDSHKELGVISSTLSSRSDYILGDSVNKLEQLISDYCAVDHAIGVGNGTDALTIILNYLKHFNDQNNKKNNIITTPLSYLASTSCIHLAGYKPVFADIDNTLNMSPQAVEELIDENTLAVIFVHYSGNPSNIKEISNICKNKDVFLIEDCAQAFGASVGDKRVGTFGDAGAVSLHPLKNLSCMGDGGLIITEDKSIAEYARKARNHGHTSRDDIDFWSMNSRLDSIQAAVTISQFKWFINEIKTRQNQYLLYKSILQAELIPKLLTNCKHALNWMVIKVPKRESLINKLDNLGIESKVHYPKLITELKPFNSSGFNYQKCLKNSYSSKDKILSIPIGSHINSKVIIKMATSIRSFYE